MPKVPDWVIRQLCVPFGARMAKKPEKWQPYMDYQSNRSSFTPPMSPYRVHGRLVDIQDRMKNERESHTGDYAGNLHGDDYRFFVGVPYVRSPFSMCRMCRSSVYNDAGRTEHNTVTDGEACTVKLVRIYRDLLATDRCVICDKVCNRKSKWGVPVCSEPCIDEWMFNMNIQYPWEDKAPKKMLLL